jgi:hypothetical protein
MDTILGRDVDKWDCGVGPTIASPAAIRQQPAGVGRHSVVGRGNPGWLGAIAVDGRTSDLPGVGRRRLQPAIEVLG